jgi:pyrroline-5-carboxylate reductase
MVPMSCELAVIGAGNMAEAIIRGVLAKGIFPPAALQAVDVSPQRRELFERDLSVKCHEQIGPAVREARRILLSVKPQQMADVLREVGASARPDALVISIAAGTRAAFIEQHLGRERAWRVVRTMPNTPMLIGEGVVAIAAGSHATAEDLADVRRIFESSATVIEVGEEKLDAVTAVSGSGPAYIFYVVEQMIRAGVELGLTAEQAHVLSVQTAVGAAKMVAQSDNSPQELRQKVTSPGGTTQAAITHLETSSWGDVLVQAIHFAHRRSREL